MSDSKKFQESLKKAAKELRDEEEPSWGEDMCNLMNFLMEESKEIKEEEE